MNCPTCGAEVRVGGRTTKYYVPKRTVKAWVVLKNGEYMAGYIFPIKRFAIGAAQDLRGVDIKYRNGAIAVRRVEISWEEKA